MSSSTPSTATALATLSKRGSNLASGPNMRDKAAQILGRQWDSSMNSEGVVNVGTAENHLMIGDIAEFVKGKKVEFEKEDFDYGEGPWGSERLRVAVAGFVNGYFEPYQPVDPEDITCANGCSSIFNMLGLALGDPGDGVLLSMPSYVGFPSDFGILANLTPVYVPFADTDQFAPSCITHYESAYQRAEDSGVRVRALMLCNPHNPLGRCYPRATLMALMKFCAAHNLHLIADEVYAMSVYDPPSRSSTPGSTPEEDEGDNVSFTSILSFPTNRYISSTLLHHVYGLSKDFCSGGLRIGCLWTLNKELQRAVSATSGFHWPGSIDQIIAATILEDRVFVRGFLEESRKKLGSASKLVRGLLDKAGVPYEGRANAGFFLWVDLSRWAGIEGAGWEGEDELVRRMEKGKVFLTKGRGQGSERPGRFRLVFSREEEVLREGVKRLMECLDM